MRRLLVGVVLALALVATGTAIAGGWATVQLSSTPAGLGPGEPWNLEITVLQHGNPETPVLNATPRLTIENAKTGEATSYDATPTGTPGVYQVRAAFPGEGVWSYRVYDGFDEYHGAETHTFAPVTIGNPAAPAVASANPPIPAPVASANPPAPGRAAEESSFPVWPVVLVVSLALLAAGVALVRRRERAARTAH